MERHWIGVLDSELHAAILWSQLEIFDFIQGKGRIFGLNIITTEEFEAKELLVRPNYPKAGGHAYHNFYFLLNNHDDRQDLLNFLKEHGIAAVSHYEPLHSSKAGKKYGKAYEDLSKTDLLTKKIIRLPFHPSVSTEQQDFIYEKLKKYFNK